MTSSHNLDRLQKVSNMLLDQKLAKLQSCAAARNTSLQRLQDLTATTASDLEPLALARSNLRYEMWADARRADLNLVLARQTAEWLEARSRAERAFGRAEVLRQFQKKQIKAARGKS
jgi:hypothetical protein